MTCAQLQLVRAHFALAGTPAEERTMRAHLPTCAECSRAYKRQLWFSRWRPGAPSPRERLAAGLGLPNAPGADRWRRFVPVLLALGAVSLVVLFSSESVGFQPRGTGLAPAVASRLLVYQRVNGAWEERLTTLAGSEPLALAYVGEAKRRFLMVWATSGDQVWWYFPAWVDPAENPRSIEVNEAGRFELPDAVTQPLPPGPVRLVALFSEHPHTVKEVEALLRQTPRPVPLVADGVERSLTLEVLE